MPYASRHLLLRYVGAELQAIPDHTSLLQHDFEADISLADKAVKSCKDDMKDRQNSIAKVGSDGAARPSAGARAPLRQCSMRADAKGLHEHMHTRRACMKRYRGNPGFKKFSKVPQAM